jgi:hypothetical protein
MDYLCSFAILPCISPPTPPLHFARQKVCVYLRIRKEWTTKKHFPYFLHFILTKCFILVSIFLIEKAFFILARSDLVFPSSTSTCEKNIYIDVRSTDSEKEGFNACNTMGFLQTGRDRQQGNSHNQGDRLNLITYKWPGSQRCPSIRMNPLY